jgi:phage/plasmid-associated DNA primase
LDSALLQAMISGESISVPRKSKKALTISSWGAHLIFASNFLPNYDDATGAISRRMVIIPYETTVEKRDPLLKDKIVKQELVKVLLRCISKYRTFLDVHREEDILDLLPEACKLESSKAVLSLDPIREFLENGNNTNIVRKKKDSQVPWSTFVSNYKMFYQEKFDRKVMVKDSDKITINSVGYHVEEVTVCKECNKDATRKNCGDHYDRNNRRRKVVIKGMQIVNKHTQTFARGPSLGKGIPNEFYQHLALKQNPDLCFNEHGVPYAKPTWPDDVPEMSSSNL